MINAWSSEMTSKMWPIRFSLRLAHPAEIAEIANYRTWPLMG
jgi:hypothetical protein